MTPEPQLKDGPSRRAPRAESAIALAGPRPRGLRIADSTPRSDGRARADEAAKRALDVVVATIGLVLSAPLWLLIAVAIKLEDRGPVFYTQERWGRNAARFRVRKFRTMVPNADKIFGNLPAAVQDRRITRVGRVLRTAGMDELPQLLAIWRGDMSFVGPRALATDEILCDVDGRPIRYEDLPGFRERLALRPGLTGIATIYRPKDIPPREKFRQDLVYIRCRSFWLDVRLILLSLWISVRGKWETRGKKV